MGVVFSLLAVFVVLKPVTSEAWTAAAPAAEAQEDSRKCSGRSPVDVFPLRLLVLIQRCCPKLGSLKEPMTGFCMFCGEASTLNLTKIHLCPGFRV